MKITKVRVDQLVIDAKNARRHGDENMKAIGSSLKRFGQVEPLVVQAGTMKVIGGNGRLEQMRRDGETHAYVHVVDMDDTQAAALGIALNRSAELGTWDDAALKAVLDSLPPDIQADVGFFDGALAEALAGGGTVGLVDQDDVPAAPDAATTVPGDIWVLGNHRLMCGDSSKPADLDRLLGGQQIHLVNTDPPYNVKVEPRSNNGLASGRNGMPSPKQAAQLRAGTAKLTKMRAKDRPLANDFVTDGNFGDTILAVIQNISRVLHPGRAFYVWGAPFPAEVDRPPNTETFPKMFRDTGLAYSHLLVWDKGHGVLGRKDFMTQYEICFYGWKKGAAHVWHGPTNAVDVWSLKRVPQVKMVHLTEKPVELATRAMEYSSRPGENVLDLFGGSGSTLIGAEMTGRRAFLMELDALYCDVIIQRWSRFTGREAVRVDIQGKEVGRWNPSASPR